MTAKEKAIEIVDEYCIIHFKKFGNHNYEYAKECALIAIDLMIEDTPEYISTFNFRLKWLKEVKQEIEKL